VTNNVAVCPKKRWALVLGETRLLRLSCPHHISHHWPRQHHLALPPYLRSFILKKKKPWRINSLTLNVWICNMGMCLALSINQLECKVDSRQNGCGPSLFGRGRDVGFALTSHALATEIKHQQCYPHGVIWLLTALQRSIQWSWGTCSPQHPLLVTPHSWSYSLGCWHASFTPLLALPAGKRFPRHT